MPRETDLAWAAGFFDGEGCTYVWNDHARQRAVMCVRINQVDTRPLQRFVEIVGYGSVHLCGRAGIAGRKNDLHGWGARAGSAEAVLEMLWPYLSEPKREQAADVRQRLAGGYEDRRAA